MDHNSFIDKAKAAAINAAVNAAVSAASELAKRVERGDIDKLGKDAQKLMRETRDSVVEAQRAIRDALEKRKTVGERKEWEKKLEQALNPPAAFRVAQELVAILKLHGPKTPDELAELFGAAAKDGTFRGGLDIAQTDGHILQHRSGAIRRKSLEARTPDSALGDKRFLQRMGLVEDRANRIVEYIHAEGVASVDELRKELGLGRRAEREDRAVFNAALEQLIAEGKVRWLAPSLYGLDPMLLQYHPAKEAFQEGNVDVEEAARRLAIATEILQRKTEKVGEGGATEGDGPSTFERPSGV